VPNARMPEVEVDGQDAERVLNVLKTFVYGVAGLNLICSTFSRGWSFLLSAAAGNPDLELLDGYLVPALTFCLFVFGRFHEVLLPYCGALVGVPLLLYWLVKFNFNILQDTAERVNVILLLLSCPLWILYPLKFYLYLLSWSSHWLGFPSSTVCMFAPISDLPFLSSIDFPDKFITYWLESLLEQTSEFSMVKVILTISFTAVGFSRDHDLFRIPQRLVGVYSKVALMAWLVPTAYAMVSCVLSVLLGLMREILAVSLQQLAITFELCVESEGFIVRNNLCEELRIDSIFFLLLLSLTTRVDFCCEVLLHILKCAKALTRSYYKDFGSLARRRLTLRHKFKKL